MRSDEVHLILEDLVGLSAVDFRYYITTSLHYYISLLL